MLEVEELIAIAHSIGNNPLAVQGNGGNVSIKPKTGLIFIKASGIRLKDVSLQQGISSVCYDESYHFKEIANSWNQKIEASSIEIYFHLYFPSRLVIHTHPTLLNCFLCSYEGIMQLKELFPKAGFLPYLNPGKEILDFLRNNQKKDFPYLFLANHGFIIKAESFSQVKQEMALIHKVMVEKYFNLEKVSSFFNLQPIEQYKEGFKSSSPLLLEHLPVIEKMLKEELYLVPDHAVYFNKESIFIKDSQILYQNIDQNMARFLDEFLHHYLFIILFLKKKGWDTQFLSKKDVERLRNRKDEKERKKRMQGL
jgi:rhamnose utilization protein RhaD (predicted bifunctional aldolase and dehydrogenase)